MSDTFLFDSWQGPARVALTAVSVYPALIFMLRISGKRTLSRMNAFDLIVTVALGSMVATIVLSKTVPLVDGVVGLFMLVGLQFLITWLSVRWPAFQGIIKARPVSLYERGEWRRKAMIRERVTEEEVHAAVRSKGRADMTGVRAIVLETDGSLTVIPDAGEASSSALAHVRLAADEP